ncbi:hypothetical protein SEA_MPHALCON_132 [Mycobacterium phage MPhalcon]|uniref:Uncharacterized protein n=2 Tax=Kostyavirus CJW1 TaxID=205869 RepID=A0A7D5KCR9_9CAUD|nr:hypothetical protein PBI_CONTAGION_127 [Mycobacterium phage Contagion]YP_008859563.1 hypothetical protein BRUIN_128 [Mycobacterium phage Bruin]AHB32078.1 hypothetical protein PBI_MOSBY_128 [Mycobacterium phage Mosby]ASZ73616.1 hypothetical protein SEA_MADAMMONKFISH_131 [Mycobacterium phage MadamMonkfish]ATN91734.1 hypothetical protein SEA_SASSAY_126 [Mycobacterium phage Sassay]ATN92117.1 hypothetical protein SEA_TERMINUS_134 [Mycobacterium phage Terminus]ATS92735.1 hypothetical protein SEA
MSTITNKYAEALESGNFHAGSVCVDCLMGLANGDWPTVGEGDWTQQSEDNANATLAEYDVTLGHLHDGPWSTCSHAGEDCEEDCDCERTTFAHGNISPCSVCNSRLSGSREDVTMVRKALLR